MAVSEPSLSTNVPEYTISELSGALKRTVEDAYGFVRVRGEVSKWFVSRQGHAYLTLKDESAVLEAVCFKPRVAKLTFRPEEGLEVVCTGKLSTYAGRSQYQLIVEDVRPHGMGALLAQLEERKQRLTAEGLFAAERKRPLPYLPEVVGVVTSPTGAVIRDILHRLVDRFPRPVLVWPVAVQGERCASEVAAAIAGFNALPLEGWPRRPDVLIVARGGGSIEDLWGFNDEAVVRAAALSTIPLISAVGHETDTTLIDLAADLRAPTPTAAAEATVPVASELRQRLVRDGDRLRASLERALQGATQRLDEIGEKLPRMKRRALDERALALRAASLRLRTPADQLRERAGRLTAVARSLDRAHARHLERAAERLLRSRDRLEPARDRGLVHLATRVHGLAQRLDSLGYQRTLARGYALVRDEAGALVGRLATARDQSRLAIEFSDGQLPVLTTSDAATPAAAAPTSPRERPKRRKSKKGGDPSAQRSLL